MTSGTISNTGENNAEMLQNNNNFMDAQTLSTQFNISKIIYLKITYQIKISSFFVAAVEILLSVYYLCHAY